MYRAFIGITQFRLDLITNSDRAIELVIQFCAADLIAIIVNFRDGVKTL